MQLPTIQQGQGLHIKQSVDARELYQSLGLDKSQWSRWQKQNIAENPFAVQGEDFEGFDMMSNGNWTQNYVLSIEFAKKLAMQVRTEMGERIRNYFLECEHKASQPVVALPDFTNPALAARAWADEYQAKQIAQEQLALAAPKVAHYDAVVERSTLLNATQVAHSVGLSSPQKLNKHLDAMGVYNGSCKRGKEFRAWFLEKGLGEMKQGNTGHQQPLFTTKGQAWIFDKLANESVA